MCLRCAGISPFTYAASSRRSVMEEAASNCTPAVFSDATKPSGSASSIAAACRMSRIVSGARTSAAEAEPGHHRAKTVSSRPRHTDLLLVISTRRRSVSSRASSRSSTSARLPMANKGSSKPSNAKVRPPGEPGLTPPGDRVTDRFLHLGRGQELPQQDGLGMLTRRPPPQDLLLQLERLAHPRPAQQHQRPARHEVPQFLQMSIDEARVLITRIGQHTPEQLGFSLLRSPPPAPSKLIASNKPHRPSHVRLHARPHARAHPHTPAAQHQTQ